MKEQVKWKTKFIYNRRNQLYYHLQFTSGMMLFMMLLKKDTISKNVRNMGYSYVYYLISGPFEPGNKSSRFIRS